MLIKRFFGFLGTGKQGSSREFDIFAKNGSQLTYAVRVASQKGVTDRSFWNQVVRRVPYVIDSINGKCLSHLASGLARAGIYDDSLWSSLLERYHLLQGEMVHEDLVIFGNALSKLKNFGEQTLIHIAHRIRDHGADVHPRYISLLLKSLASVGYRNQELVEPLLEQAGRRASEMGTATIAILLDGMYNIGYLQRGVFLRFGRRLKQILREGADKSDITMSNTLNAEEEPSDAGSASKESKESGNHSSDERMQLSMDSHVRATLDVNSIVKARVYDKELFEILHREMRRMNKRFKPVDIVMIANSMSKSKLHDKPLLKLLSNRVIKEQKRFTIDMKVLYLHGICMPSGNDKDFFSKILSSILKELNKVEPKHALTMMQIITKVDLPLGTCSSQVRNCLLGSYEKLSPLELVNAIGYMTKLYPGNQALPKMVERYFHIYNGDDCIRNAQQLSILYYALSKLKDPSYDAYSMNVLDLLENVTSRNYEPIHVANVLRAMLLRGSARPKIVEAFTSNIETNIKMFTPQLLSSSLESLLGMKHNSDGICMKLCKEVAYITRKAVLKDCLQYFVYLLQRIYPSKLTTLTWKHELLKALEHLVNVIFKEVEEGRHCENIETLLAQGVHAIGRFRDCVDEGDQESHASLGEIKKKLLVLRNHETVEALNIKL